ncbi:hypothetical protein PQX77_015894 [Marasmius sp. AFHP31]|nr:hypothetical protein PQX77_015894 [Marasmius sp. AFHP31]
MYSRQGKKHELITGLQKCYFIAREHEKTWDAVNRGIPLYYGKSPLQRRQKLKESIHRTKRTRTSTAIKKQSMINREKARSHRPPDTIDTLIPKRRTRGLSRAHIEPHPEPHLRFQSPVAETPIEKDSKSGQRRKPLVVHPDLLSPPPSSSAPSDSDYETPDSSPPPRLPPTNQLQTRETSVHRPDASIISTHFQMVDDENGRSQLLISSKIKDVIGLRWFGNSCWLDSPMEVVFWAEMRDFRSIASILADQEERTVQLPFTPIIASFDQRRRLLLSNSSPKSISDQLFEAKTDLRRYIVRNGWTRRQIEDDFDNDISWLVDALTATRKTGDHQLSNHYGVHTITFKWCTGEDLSLLNRSDTSEITFSHNIIGKVDRSRPLLRIPSSEYGFCNGDFAIYLQRYTTNFIEHTQEMGTVPCWHAHEGDLWCSGLAMSCQAIVSLPQTLIARVEREDLESEWTFPATLFPVLNDNKAREVGLEYEIVGRIFYNGTHYTARFAGITDTPKRAKAMFFYDGLGVKGGKAGYSVKESGGIAKSLGGWNIPMPTGYGDYRTTTVIYKLRGGRKAQEWFWEQQKDLLKSKLGIILSPSYAEELESQPAFNREGFAELPIEKMVWLGSATRMKPLPYREYTKTDLLSEPLSHKTRRNPFLSFDETDGILKPDSVQETDPVDQFMQDSIAPEEDRPSQPPSFSASLSPRPDNTLLSPPSTPIPFDCRCGEGQDGNYHPIRQDAIECDECGKYSHLACQTYFDPSISVTSEFICQKCRDGSYTMIKPSQTRIIKAELELRSNVKQRLRCGLSVLVKDGRYWYVARLIFKEMKSRWIIKWWYGNQVGEGAKHIPGTYETVSATRIVDSLYGDVEGRRAIRLGRWTTVPETIEDKEAAHQALRDIVEDPKKSIPYTPQVHEALVPHQDRLTRLIHKQSELDLGDFPTIRYARQYHFNVVPFTGGLDLETQSQIVNWVHHNIPDIQQRVPLWTVDGTLQDALMLWIEHRDRAELEALPKCPEAGSQRDRYIREQAWRRLTKSTSGRDMELLKKEEHVDVDLESLLPLELRMFDRSREAGHAGNCQWGLDIGINQDNWWPYRHFDRNVDHDRDDEEETKPGPQFDQDPYTVQWRKAEQRRKDEEAQAIKNTSRPKAQPRRKIIN